MPEISSASLRSASSIHLSRSKPGRSKAAMHAHRDFAFNTEVYAKATMGYRADDVTVSIAGEPLESWPAEPSGVIDRWIAVPDRLVGRSIALTVAVNTTGNEGRCNEFRPVVLTVLGSSVVETTPANPPDSVRNKAR